jgi:hypothetical protein
MSFLGTQQRLTHRVGVTPVRSPAKGRSAEGRIAEAMATLTALPTALLEESLVPTWIESSAGGSVGACRSIAAQVNYLPIRYNRSLSE